MSSMGITNGEWDHMPGMALDDVKARMMAQILQGRGLGQQDPFGGIGQAIAMKAMQNRQAQRAYEAAPPVTASIPFQGMNGQPQQTQLSQKLPYMGAKGISGLFNFGGGS